MFQGRKFRNYPSNFNMVLWNNAYWELMCKFLNQGTWALSNHDVGKSLYYFFCFHHSIQ